jgi:hypothetical protein
MINATLDLEAFPLQVVAGLRLVVAAPFGSYNEIDHRAAQISYVVEPAEARVPHLELIVRQYLHEQPMVAHYRRTGDGSPRKLSDFLTRKEFHRLTIYNENYRRTGVEYQIAFMLHSLQWPSPCTIAIALDRSRGDSDFTEHDRGILSLLRPHLLIAYANAETVSALAVASQPEGRLKRAGASSSPYAEPAGISSRRARRIGSRTTSRTTPHDVTAYPMLCSAGSTVRPLAEAATIPCRRPRGPWL